MAMSTQYGNSSGTSTAGQQRIGDAEFKRIQSIMYDHVGIVLQENKRALVEARVNKRLRALQISSYGQYLDFLANDSKGVEMVQLTDAISTNVTHFFRENEHFDFTTEAVNKWLAAGRNRLRFWSAACSTGEEPYSLAMTLQNINAASKADIKILATDISTRVLKIAAQGRYENEKIASIPTAVSKRSFRSVDGGMSEVVPDLKSKIMFRRMNLNKTPYPIKGAFDIIFCRNVMIYFDAHLRKRIVEQAHRLLQPDGYLIIGHAETLIGVDTRFKFVQPSVYRKV
jgi:chemotaxis protein methyltransferase CheR